MKKIYVFLCEIAWIFKQGFKRIFKRKGKMSKINVHTILEKEKIKKKEEILMLNKKYLQRYSGCKRYVKCPTNGY